MDLRLLAKIGAQAANCPMETSFSELLVLPPISFWGLDVLPGSEDLPPPIAAFQRAGLKWPIGPVSQRGGTNSILEHVSLLESAQKILDERGGVTYTS
jgi:hypothetical protein